MGFSRAGLGQLEDKKIVVLALKRYDFDLGLDALASSHL